MRTPKLLRTAIQHLTGSKVLGCCEWFFTISSVPVHPEASRFWGRMWWLFCTWLVVWNMTFMTFHLLGMSSSPLTTSYFSEGWRKTTNQVQIVLVPNDSVLGSQLFLTRDDNWWAVWPLWAVCYTLNTSWHPEQILWPSFHDQNVSKNEQIVTISNPHLPLSENWIPHSIWSARSCSVWNLPGIRASNLQTHPTIKLVGCIYIYYIYRLCFQ